MGGSIDFQNDIEMQPEKQNGKENLQPMMMTALLVMKSRIVNNLKLTVLTIKTSFNCLKKEEKLMKGQRLIKN